MQGALRSSGIHPSESEHFRTRDLVDAIDDVMGVKPLIHCYDNKLSEVRAGLTSCLLGQFSQDLLAVRACADSIPICDFVLCQLTTTLHISYVFLCAWDHRFLPSRCLQIWLCIDKDLQAFDCSDVPGHVHHRRLQGLQGNTACSDQILIPPISRSLNPGSMQADEEVETDETVAVVEADDDEQVRICLYAHACNQECGSLSDA